MAVVSSTGRKPRSGQASEYWQQGTGDREGYKFMFQTYAINHENLEQNPRPLHLVFLAGT